MENEIERYAEIIKWFGEHQNEVSIEDAFEYMKHLIYFAKQVEPIYDKYNKPDSLASFDFTLIPKPRGKK